MTRAEGRAYSLGIFDVNMPATYVEKMNAFSSISGRNHEGFQGPSLHAVVSYLVQEINAGFVV